MFRDLATISQQLFNRDRPEDIEPSAIDDLLIKYPYFAAARFLKAWRSDNTAAVNEDHVTAGLYMHNPLRLYPMLHQQREAVEEKATPEPVVQPPAADERQVLQSTDESPIVFQSYHTIDYFASQGIRLQQAELTKDRLGQQLKSFTEWLRSMKKLPASESEIPATDTGGSHQRVAESAAHSIEPKEVVTEAMAEVWAKQGNRDKAMDIYHKLSLQNPSKNDYFAAKIEQLKDL